MGAALAGPSIRAREPGVPLASAIHGAGQARRPSRFVERLEALKGGLQRIGLSATQRPLD